MEEKSTSEDNTIDIKKRLETHEMISRDFPTERTEPHNLPLFITKKLIGDKSPLSNSDRSNLTERKLVENMTGPNVDLRALTSKFEMEKNMMESQLAQFKKIIETNKLEIQRPKESHTHGKAQKENVFQKVIYY